MKTNKWQNLLPCRNCVIVPACSKFCEGFTHYKEHLLVAVRQMLKEYGGYQGAMDSLELYKDELNLIYRVDGYDHDLIDVVNAFNRMYTVRSKIIERMRR
jgi:hypothetical protein